MGIRLFSMSAERCAGVQQRLPNDPNPARFFIREEFSVGRFRALRVEYPDCTNYKGMKILVIEYIGDPGDIKELDPHFHEGGDWTKTGGYKMLARFEPTNEGWRSACRYVHERYDYA